MSGKTKQNNNKKTLAPTNIGISIMKNDTGSFWHGGARNFV